MFAYYTGRPRETFCPCSTHKPLKLTNLFLYKVARFEPLAHPRPAGHEELPVLSTAAPSNTLTAYVTPARNPVRGYREFNSITYGKRGACFSERVRTAARVQPPR
eukprot:919322-Rhodomonas_salina.1